MVTGELKSKGMMVELMDPKADEIICDPIYGSGGVMGYANDYIYFESTKQNIPLSLL